MPRRTGPLTAAGVTPSPPASSSDAEIPETIETYPGTRGRTQGETKERIPAPKATRTPAGSAEMAAGNAASSSATASS